MAALSYRPVVGSGLVIDTNAKVAPSKAAELKAAGVEAIWRYIFFGSPRPGDIDLQELYSLMGAGLTVLLVQHVRNPGWMNVSSDQGNADGMVAVANAKKAGYIGPLSLALDMEGLGHPAKAFEHANAWCAVVRAASYRPVVYVGYDSGLTPQQLDKLGPDVVFWCDFAPLAARPMPSRGYSLHQQQQSTLCGVGVDRNLVLQENALVGLCLIDRAYSDPDPAITPTVDKAA